VGSKRKAASKRPRHAKKSTSRKPRAKARPKAKARPRPKAKPKKAKVKKTRAKPRIRPKKPKAKVKAKSKVAATPRGPAAAKAGPAPTDRAKGRAQPEPGAAGRPEEKGPSYEEILAKLPFGEGSFVVHPKYGLGKVDRVTERKLSTGIVPCMEISFPYQEMKLTIPVDQVLRSGLREPIGRREISNVFKVLRGRATFDAKRRSAKRVVDYRKRLSLGDPTSLAEAVRDLARLSLRKSLSYEERKILGTALRILSREVALARGREPDDVREEIERIVYR
jgi:CarD family transcriptional regulator